MSELHDWWDDLVRERERCVSMAQAALPEALPESVLCLIRYGYNQGRIDEMNHRGGKHDEPQAVGVGRAGDVVNPVGIGQTDHGLPVGSDLGRMVGDE